MPRYLSLLYLSVFIFTQMIILMKTYQSNNFILQCTENMSKSTHYQCIVHCSRSLKIAPLTVTAAYCMSHVKPLLPREIIKSENASKRLVSLKIRLVELISLSSTETLSSIYIVVLHCAWPIQTLLYIHTLLHLHFAAKYLTLTIFHDITLQKSALRIQSSNKLVNFEGALTDRHNRPMKSVQTVLTKCS